MFGCWPGSTHHSNLLECIPTQNKQTANVAPLFKCLKTTDQKLDCDIARAGRNHYKHRIDKALSTMDWGRRQLCFCGRNSANTLEFSEGVNEQVYIRKLIHTVLIVLLIRDVLSRCHLQQLWGSGSPPASPLEPRLVHLLISRLQVQPVAKLSRYPRHTRTHTNTQH